MQQRVFIVEAYCDQRKQPHMSLGTKVFMAIDDMNTYVTYLEQQNIPNNWYIAPIYPVGSSPTIQG